MKKEEFLQELRNALDGKLSEADIDEITSDYGDLFDNKTAGGLNEDAVAAEIGSPAKIARTILEDLSGSDGQANHRNSGGQREYTDFQKNINEKTSKLFDKIVEPDKHIPLQELSPMSRRLGAYIIDSILLGAVFIILALALYAPVAYMGLKYPSVGVNVRPMSGIMGSLVMGRLFMLFLIGSGFNFFTALFLWATNGYTPGKWLLKMRVVKINGKKLSFLDALLRDVAIKCIANSMLSGFLNIGSFIWGCATEDHKTVHDLAAQTRVVDVRGAAHQGTRNPNPLED
jgi:uncharacterized RDD family membrane protein YckC